MPTIIDSLVVSLGLDPKDFDAGQKKAAESFLKTRRAIEDEGKKVETSAKAMSDGINTITRRALELYAVFLGGRGLKQFVSDLIDGDAALGRFSANLGMSPQLVSDWQLAVERIGGTGAGVASTMERLGKSLYDLRYNATGMPKEFFQLEAAANMRIPTDGGLPAFMDSLAAALKKVYDANPARAHFMAEALGIDDSTFNLMVKYGSSVDKYVKSLQSLAPTEQAIAASQKLQESWVTLEQQATSLGNALITTLGPDLAKIIGQMTEWVNQHHDEFVKRISDAIQQFATWIKSIDWKSVGNGMANFASGAKSAADAVGGIVEFTKILFELWLGAQFYKVLANAKLLGAAGISGGGGLNPGGIGGSWTTMFGLAGIFDAMSRIPFFMKSSSDQKATMADQNSWAANLPLIGPLWKAGNAAHDFLFGPSDHPGDPNSPPPQKDIVASAQESYNFWQSKGLNLYAALAMVGNEQGESSFNPGAVGDGGNSRGSFQWSKTRRDDILAGSGIDVWDQSTSHAQMLKAAYWEMTQGHDAGARAAWDALSAGPTTVGEGVGTAVTQFERSKDQPGDIVRRTQYGEQMAPALDLSGLQGSDQPSAGVNADVPSAKSAAATSAMASIGPAISQAVHIGSMVVNSAAKDAAGIANDIFGAITNQRKTAASNTGLF